MTTDTTMRETAHLISSEKVEGTPVRRSDGTKVGSIENVMIEKRTGRVVYAVMSFGGFLGMGEEYYALPWNALRYNERLDAYELNVTDEQLRSAPAAASGFFDTGAADRRWEGDLHRHYSVPQYW